MIFTNREIRKPILTRPVSKITPYQTEEGNMVTTAEAIPWEWEIEIITDDPITYQKLDLIVQFTGHFFRYSVDAAILTGFPIWNSTGDTMENVPGLGVMDPAVILWDNLKMRSIVRGIGTEYRLGNKFRIAQSVIYNLPGNGGGQGGGGGGN